jgi:uncharacterized membrane protein
MLRDEEGVVSARAIWIMWGMLFGIVMWFNVWFIIWPAQRKLLRGMPNSQLLARRVSRTSRLNTYLSAPMLFCMIAPNNYAAFSWPLFLSCGAIGVVVMRLLFWIAPRAGAR